MNSPVTMADDDLRDLYRELILDHAKSPRHFGKLPSATHEAEGINPLCGDKLHLYLEIDDENRIHAARFEGSGCAISVASASLMTDGIAGLTTADAVTRALQLTAALTGDPDVDSADLGKLAALRGVRDYPARVKCATLAWHALQAAIERRGATATTE